MLSESEDESLDLPGSSSYSVFALASGTSGSERVVWKMRLDMLAGSGCCVNAKLEIQCLLFVHCSVTERWRIVAVSGGLENLSLDYCNWRVQSNSDGAVRSSPLS